MTEANALKMRRFIRAKLEAAPDAAISDVARNVLADEALFVPWALGKLTLLIRAERRAMRLETRPPDPYQMFFEGFRDLYERLPLNDGGTVPLAKATITHLRKNLKTLRDKAEEKAQRTINLIEEMRPYAQRQRGLTVARYCELRAAGIEPRAAAKKNAKSGKKGKAK